MGPIECRARLNDGGRPLKEVLRRLWKSKAVRWLDVLFLGIVPGGELLDPKEEEIRVWSRN